MAKYNFNVALLDEKGNPQQKVKLDNAKMKEGDRPGLLRREVIKDEDGNAVMENIILKDVLCGIINSTYPGEENLTQAERVRRGRLVRKLATSSTANYRADDIQTIEELLVKSNASPTIVAQVQDIVHGIDPEYAAENLEPAGDEPAAAHPQSLEEAPDGNLGNDAAAASTATEVTGAGAAAENGHAETADDAGGTAEADGLPGAQDAA